MLKLAKKIYDKISKNKSIHNVPKNKSEKTEVVSLIIQSEETIPIMVTMSFNKIEQVEKGDRCVYMVNDKSVITVERDGNIESIKSINLLARLFIDR